MSLPGGASYVTDTSACNADYAKNVQRCSVLCMKETRVPWEAKSESWILLRTTSSDGSDFTKGRQDDLRFAVVISALLLGGEDTQ